MTTAAAETSSEYNDLTDRQRMFVDLAARHADDFATRAAEHDRDATFAFENFAAMHESGYARICLPEKFRGQDATLEELALAQERLAQGCASTALGANMHLFATGTMAEAYRNGREELAMPLQLVGETGVTVGGAISEAESADPFGHPSGKVERVEGGYRINGRKVFGSNTPINPIVMFNGVIEENGKRNVVMMQFPKETPGVHVIEDWDTMGMRATASYTIEFKDCFVPDMFATRTWEQGVPIEDNEFARSFICWFGPTIGAVYTGIGVAARDLARDGVKNKSRLPYGPIKHTPSVQYTIAEMYVTIEACRAFVRRSAKRLSDPAWRDADAVALAVATKVFGTEHAKRVVDLAMELTGGGSFFKRLPLERLYRDVRAGGFHPLPRYDAYEAIGKAELGIPDNQTPRFV